MPTRELFTELEALNKRPAPFEYYTAPELWTDEHTSAQMLAYHLNGDIDVSSRNTAFIDRSVGWIISHFQVGTNTRIADFGCGPGLYASRLARAGAAVTGIDFSERSIDYARKTASDEGLPATYVCENYLTFETDVRFDLIIMIMCDFCALSPEQRRIMLGKFHTLLKSGGSVLLDVYTLNAFDQREEGARYEKNQLNGFWSPDPYYGFVTTFKYETEKVILDKYTIIEANRTRTVYNWLQHFDPDKLTQELEMAGFSVDGCYADVAGSPFDPTYTECALIGTKS